MLAAFRAAEPLTGIAEPCSPMPMRGYLGTAVIFAGAVLLSACARRPTEMKRDERLDSECRAGSSAFVYPIHQQLVEKAVLASCYAPVGAWTDASDLRAGGVRKLVYELRENEQMTLLCCPAIGISGG